MGQGQSATPTPPLRVGEVARRAGVSVDTIRHYERLGLIGPSRRSQGGYRLFQPDTVARVQLIRNAVRVGFSLAQLGTFLRARHSGRPPCREVRMAAAGILDSMNEQIATLTSTRDAVRRMLEEWDARLAATPRGQPAQLLDALDAGGPTAPRAPAANLRRRR